MTPILVQPVVMAGGGGTRLWPLSRAGFPKQFLALGGTETLFQAAVARLAGICRMPTSSSRAPIVVGNDEHRFLIQEQLRELGRATPATLLLEPVGRNTAPAMTLAALQAAEGDLPVLVVVPADQTVTDGAAFRGAIAAAVRIAADGAICILGITPDRPETGYGYVLAELDRRRRRAGRALRREARRRNRRALPGRRRLLLEQRHLRAARLRLAGGARAVPPRHPRRGPQPPGTGAAPTRSSSARTAGLRRRAVGIGRLRGHGALPRQRHRPAHRAARRRLERPRRLGRGLAVGREGRRRQLGRRRRAAARRAQHPCARDQPARRRRRPRRRGRGRDRRRRARRRTAAAART